MTGATLTLWKNRPVNIVERDYQGGSLITDPAEANGPLFVVPTDELQTVPVPEAPSREGLAQVPRDTWEKTEQRFKAAKALIATPDLTTAIVEQAAISLGITVRTVYRDMRRVERAERPSALVPQTPGRKEGLRLLDSRVEECISHFLEEVYLKKNRPAAAQVCAEIQAACERDGLPVPCTKSITRRMHSLDAYEILKKRNGPKAARYKLKAMVGHVTAALPLDMVQMDHTPANVLVVSDDELREEIGRPVLTMAMDVCTRVVLGFHISFLAASSATTALCLTHALLPKVDWLESIGLEVTWPFFGKMKMLHTDNGADFQAEALRRGCAELGIEISFRQIGAPHQGGHIERLMGTFSGLFTLVPGATQRDTRERGDKDARTRPVMTLNELRRFVANEIAIYHNKVHRGLNCTPVEKWNAAIKDGFAPPRVPDDWERLNTLCNFLPYEKRLIRRTGIQLCDIHYWAPGLDEWIADGKKREVFYDPRDISVIYLRGPTGMILEAKPTRSDIPAISRQEWRALRARQRNGANPSIRAAHDKGLKTRRDLIGNACKATRMAHRATSKRDELDRDVSAMRTTAVREPLTTPPIPQIPRTKTTYSAERWSAP